MKHQVCKALLGMARHFYLFEVRYLYTAYHVIARSIVVFESHIAEP